MRKTISFDVHHLARIEGHGNIVVRVENGDLVEARWDIVETPRYFEVMFKGKHFTSAHMLASRICGICSISHCLAALRATENAFAISIPARAAALRLLAKHGETIQSHTLHLFFLAAPDFLGLDSVVPLIETKPEVVNLAVRLKGLANRMCDIVAGRTTHPVSLQVGGVAATPQRAALIDVRNDLEKALADLAATVDLFATFEIPDFTRETEFVSLKGEAEYPFIGGRLISSDGVERAEDEYLEMTNEYVDPRNTSKWSRLSRESYAVGPLARFNNNFELLHAEARKVARRLGLEPVCHNPFMAHVARLAECIHCALDSVRLIDELTAEPFSGASMAPAEARPAKGIAAVEAPRGMLVHAYDYDAGGRVLAADCVVPTTQNNGNIHRDLPALVQRYVQEDATDRELELICSMLVRSYDPCVSCSVH